MKMWCLIMIAFMLTGAPQAANAAKEPMIEKDPVEMVDIPAGPFIRGNAPGEGRLDEQPRRKIYLNAFAIDKYEVSNAQYMKFLDETLHKPPLNVFADARSIRRRGLPNSRSSRSPGTMPWIIAFWAGKRLPTEAEWEKAARGADGRLFPWGNEPPTAQKANYEKDWEGKQTFVEVTALPDGQSPSGLFNMSGNVREWVQDWYDPEYYSIAPEKNPKGPETGILKVLRGGSWSSFDADLTVTSRGKGRICLKNTWHWISMRAGSGSGSDNATKPAP
jgi:formylglycine-generating enzyme